jgi:hypothetical protein
MNLTFGSASDRADAGAFLARVTRLDPSAPVRVRCAGGVIALWAWLPLEVLVTRQVRGAGPLDVTVDAGLLRDRVAVGDVVGVVGVGGVSAAGHGAPGGDPVPLPANRDTDWPGALPPESGVHELDEIPAEVVQSLLAAGERTFREASLGADPRAVGDALLDHDVLTVSAGESSAALPLRLLLGLARMGFLGAEPLRVGLAGGWVRVAASYGVAYRRRGKLALLPTPR